MKTLQELALNVVPNPGLMARTYLVPHHPLAIQLEAKEFEQQRNTFRKEHKVLFRYVFVIVFRRGLVPKIYSNLLRCRKILKSLFWIKDCHWLNVKTKVLMIMLE